MHDLKETKLSLATLLQAGGVWRARRYTPQEGRGKSMKASISAIPGRAIAVAVFVLALSIFVILGPGFARAQDSTPGATPAVTETTTPTPEPPTTVTTTPAADFAVGDELVVADGPLNVREQAGVDAAVVTQLDTGSLVTVVGGPETAGDYSWYQVETSAGDSGWVAGDFLGTEVNTGFAVGDSVVVADGPLNVRDGAGLNANVLFQVDTGAGLEIAGGAESADDLTWYQVLTTDDQTGWAAGEFLGTEVASPGFAEGDEVVVVDGPLNVRDDGSLNGAVLLQMENGEGGTILSGPVSADNFNWYQIQIDTETSGWVAGEFLALAGGSTGTPTGASTFSVGDGVRVAVDNLNFRSDASLNADVLDTLDLDALFLVEDGPVSADGYTWYKVYNYYYGEGWVAGELMTLEPEGFPAEEVV
jgi:uncharacterized protein YgiM (DUF1202 family)